MHNVIVLLVWTQIFYLNFLPDANWRPYFDDGLTPKDAIDEAVMDAWDDMLDMQDIWEDHCAREAV